MIPDMGYTMMIVNIATLILIDGMGIVSGLVLNIRDINN